MVSWRSIYLPPTDSFTDVQTLPTWGKVLTSLLKPPDWQFKGWLTTATAPCCQTRPLGSCHFFLSPPRDARNVTILRDARWIGGLTKVMIYPVCANLNHDFGEPTNPPSIPEKGHISGIPGLAQKEVAGSQPGVMDSLHI